MQKNLQNSKLVQQKNRIPAINQVLIENTFVCKKQI